VHHVLSYSTEPKTRQSTRDVLQAFQRQVGGKPVFEALIFTDQRTGNAYQQRDGRVAGGYRAVGAGKDVVCAQRPFHAIVDDNAGICKACRSRGIHTYPIRRGVEKHRWTGTSYADVLAAAEAISALIDDQKAAREGRLTRLAGPSRAGRSSVTLTAAAASLAAVLPRLPRVQVADSSDEDQPGNQR
jgi:hypothetical protein